jgi:hypothetical protein
LNCGKRGITLNLEHPEARSLFHSFILNTDILVESYLPGTLERLGFGYRALAEINPRLIVVSISNFGQSGPRQHWKATDIVHYAMGGAMSLTGDSDQPPLNSGPAIAEYTAGLHAYLSALLAVQRRHVDGIGEWVDVSIQESGLENVEIKLAEALLSGLDPQRNGDSHPLIPWECYPTADGIAAIIGGPLRNWQHAASAFGNQSLVDPPFHTIIGRNAQREEVHQRVRAAVQSQTKHEIYHRGQAAGLAFGYLANLVEVLQWPQHIARHFFQPTEPHPVVGSLHAMTAPFHSAVRSWTIGRAPLLGEHNEIAYAEIGHSSKAVSDLMTAGIL